VSGRALTSKRLRAALWISARGHCQRCGVDLQAGWHADHTKPWTVTRRTNVHEMAALCGRCNLKKGATMPRELRQHQQDLRERAADIASGRTKDRVTVAEVTPGGGKSLAAAVFARVLIEQGIADRVCWVTPRTSLAAQAAEGFWDAEHNPAFRARRADNTPPLIRDEALGCIAYTTTYQGVSACPELHRDELDRGKYLLVLDEPHHMADADGRAWVRAIRPLFDRAAHVLLMTGTIERHDGEPIPFIDYTERDGRRFPAVHVEYKRRDALKERSVLPIHFTYVDGWAHFCDGGEERRVEISKALDEDVSKVIATFLGRTEYREAFLRRGLDHWMAHSANVYPSRAIVICANQTHAKEVREFIASVYRVQVALAISEDADSQRTLKQFRQGKRGEVLVTVGMAYEGLDVPDCSHLLCLTNTRSVPWLEQAFARVTRVDYKATAAGIEYARQFAFVFVPDDIRMREVVDRMKAEQADGIRERDERDPPASAAAPRQESIFAALGADEGSISHGTFDGRMSSDDSRRVEEVRKSMPSLAHAPAEDIMRAVRTWFSLAPSNTAPPVAPPVDDEASLRKKIQGVCTARDRQRAFQFGTTNKMLLRHFGKSREEMGVSELQRVLNFLVSEVEEGTGT